VLIFKIDKGEEVMYFKKTLLSFSLAAGLTVQALLPHNVLDA
jgi:hypothetical protein